MELSIFEDADALARGAAEVFTSLGAKAIAERGRFLVALSGGATPARLYQHLRSEPARSALAWDRVVFFWGDERPVPPEHPDSNYRLALEGLLRPLDVPEANVHRLRAEAADPAEAARAYEEELARVFGVPMDGKPPVFDLVLLGLGADGHTASLFPGTGALGEESRWVVANPVPKLVSTRLTMTLPLLNQAACVLFLVAGADKMSALAQTLAPEPGPNPPPARLIRPPAGRLLIFADRAAAAGLPPSILQSDSTNPEVDSKP